MPKGEYLQYGGQAIIEGVMMRSPRFFAVACRAPNGDIVLETEALEKTWIGRQKWLKYPFLRGSLALIDAMALGVKAMRFASNVQMDPAYQKKPEGDGPHVVEKPMDKRVQDIAIGGTIVVSFAMALFIFNYLPNLIAQPLQQRGASGTLINFATEIVKVIFFIGYIWLIGQMKDIQEVFKYHGAEHKAINAMEAERPLSIENCAAQTRLHPRCGTSFAIIVLIVSMVIFTFVPRYPFSNGQPTFYLRDVTTRFLLELMILPIISGISYELIRFAGKFRNSRFVMGLFWPGLMSQYLTTREPDEKQIEVALVALRAVVEAEEDGTPLEDEPPSNAIESASPAPIGL
jgi:uncharacterized protein YqhQ